MATADEKRLREKPDAYAGRYHRWVTAQEAYLARQQREDIEDYDLNFVSTPWDSRVCRAWQCGHPFSYEDYVSPREIDFELGPGLCFDCRVKEILDWVEKGIDTR